MNPLFKISGNKILLEEKIATVSLLSRLVSKLCVRVFISFISSAKPDILPLLLPPDILSGNSIRNYEKLKNSNKIQITII